MSDGVYLSVNAGSMINHASMGNEVMKKEKTDVKKKTKMVIYVFAYENDTEYSSLEGRIVCFDCQN